MKTAKIFLLYSFMASSVWAGPSNPFKAGTGTELLPETTVDDFRVGFEDADRSLRDALDAARTLNPDKAFQATSQAAINYVIAVGFKRKRLVTVLVLNQALELVYGIPNPSGQGTATAPLLGPELNPDLRATVMKESLELAYDLAQKSKRKTDWTHLDYEDAALLRTSRGLEWAQSALEIRPRFEVLRALVAQWYNFVTKTDFQYPERWGALLIEADQRLRQCQIQPAASDYVPCVNHFSTFLTQVLKDSKVDVRVPHKTYKALSHSYFGGLTIADEIDEMARSLKALSQQTLPEGSPEREALLRKAWMTTRSLIQRRSEITPQHRSSLITWMRDGSSYQLNLHAAYVLSVAGTAEDRNAIAVRGSSYSGGSQRLQFARIARNPDEVLSLLEMTR
jgi:hypothetical protein